MRRSEKDRARISKQTEAFLAGGGSVQTVPFGYLAKAEGKRRKGLFQITPDDAPGKQGANRAR